MTAQICIIIAIVVYLVAMIWIGFLYSKKNENSDDFYLGGRHLSPLVTAMSAEASDMSSWLLMGLPGVAYLSGMADASWTAIGLAVGTYLNWLFVAKRLRRYSTQIGAITIPEFFSKRFGDRKNILTCVAAIVIVVFFIPYTASGFAACGKLFNTLFGTSYTLTMILSAVVIAFYCTTGGFKAVCMTDLIQSICMTIALFIVICFGISVAGGPDAVLANARSLPGYLSMHSSYNVADGTAKPYGFLTILSTTAWGLGYFGMPHILVRFMAIEDENKIKVSRRIASIWAPISMAVAILIGIVGYTMSQTGALPVLEGRGDAEKIIVKIAALMSTHGIVPALIAGVILSGILAATMSTADSQLLASASSISQDLLQTFAGIKVSEKTSVRIAKLTVVLISVLAIFIARDPDSSVFAIVSFAWAGFGAAFGPVMLLALFWKRANKQGALAGMIVGGVMVFVWKYGIARLGGAFAIYELLPAFLFGLFADVIVSLATPAPDQAVLNAFDAAGHKPEADHTAK